MSRLEFLRSSCHLLSSLWNNPSPTQRRWREQKPGYLSENLVCLLLWIILWQDKLLKTFCLFPFWYAPVDQFSQNLAPYGCGPTNREENAANISWVYDAYPLMQMKITDLTLCFCNFITWETNIDIWAIPEYQVTLKWGYISNGLDQLWSSEWLKNSYLKCWGRTICQDQGPKFWEDSMGVPLWAVSSAAWVPSSR